VRTRVKMCGLTNAVDASAAVAAGADALGVVLAPSPRQLTIEQAAEVLRDVPPFVAKAGVFVDPEPAYAAEAVARIGLHVVQLSGMESPQTCLAVADAIAHTSAGYDARGGRACPSTDGSGARMCVVKALRVGEGFGTHDVEPYRRHCSAILMDTAVGGLHGGTGRTFDWTATRFVPADMPLVLAGGLNAGNVSEAILAADAYAVDVSSGVESSPGIKDHHKIALFIAAVCAADREKGYR